MQVRAGHCCRVSQSMSYIRSTVQAMQYDYHHDEDNRIDIEFEYTSLEVLGDFAGVFVASLNIQ